MSVQDITGESSESLNFLITMDNVQQEALCPQV